MTEQGALGLLAGYPHLYPPPVFDPFNRGKQNLVLGIGETLLESISPKAQGYKGWLHFMSLEATDFTKCAFTLRLNGSPIEEYTGINFQMGSLLIPRTVLVEMRMGHDLTLTVKATAAVTISYSMMGWMFQKGGC